MQDPDPAHLVPARDPGHLEGHERGDHTLANQDFLEGNLTVLRARAERIEERLQIADDDRIATPTKSVEVFEGRQRTVGVRGAALPVPEARLAEPSLHTSDLLTVLAPTGRHVRLEIRWHLDPGCRADLLDPSRGRGAARQRALGIEPEEIDDIGPGLVQEGIERIAHIPLTSGRGNEVEVVRSQGARTDEPAPFDGPPSIECDRDPADQTAIVGREHECGARSAHRVQPPGAQKRAGMIHPVDERVPIGGAATDGPANFYGHHSSPCPSVGASVTPRYAVIGVLWPAATHQSSSPCTST